MKRYYKKRIRRFIEILSLLIILFFIIILCSKKFVELVKIEGKGINDSNSTVAPTKEAEAAGNSSSVIHLDADRLISRNAILVRLSDQKVMLDKNSKDTIYPASLTKIMTALVAIENLNDLNQPIHLPSEMFHDLYKDDASMAGFLPNETVPAIDLLYGVILPSGAECCIGLANYISGSEDTFVDLMNEKAKELDMQGTHFTNSTGLNDANHYTTAKDLAKLLEYALKNDTFREIFTSIKHSTSTTSLHPDGITFYSTMFKKMTSKEFEGGSFLGGKTGYTSEAGLCLASLANINHTEYILVTADAKGDHNTEQYNISDALYIYKNLN